MKLILTAGILTVLSSITSAFLLEKDIAASLWGPWGQWKCSESPICVVLRNRTCTVDGDPKHCFSTESDIQLIPWINPKHPCPCATEKGLTNQNGQGTWGGWNSWACSSVSNTCFAFRKRNCSVPRDDMNCKATNNYQLAQVDDCCLTGIIPTNIPIYHTSTPSPTTNILPHWTTWGEWTCKATGVNQCYGYRFRNCSTYDKNDCTAGDDNEFGTCALELCQPVVPPHWEEWGKWVCGDSSLQPCFMKRSRNCSTNVTSECTSGSQYDVQICDTDNCQAHWLHWSPWKCAIRNNGYCFMARTRNCSSGDVDDCTGDHSKVTLCTKEICPDLVQIQESGICASYSGGPCVDQPGCDTDEETANYLCHEAASTLCPKHCGCCENTYEEKPHWTEWTTTGCSLVPPGRCEAKRARQCIMSAESSTGCSGQSRDVTNCTQSNCPELYMVQSNCDTNDPVNDPCVDSAGCIEFTNTSNLAVLCPEGGSLCPLSCGCCEITTTTSTTTTTTTTTPATTTITAPSTVTDPVTTTTVPSTTLLTTTKSPTTTILFTATSKPTTQGPPGVSTTASFSTPSTSSTSSVRTTFLFTPYPTGPVTATSPFISTTTIATSPVETTTTAVNLTSTPTAVNTTSMSAVNTTPMSAVNTAFAMTTLTMKLGTTAKLPYTLPPISTQCAVCSGPEEFCESVYTVQTCSPPNNYCINKVTNNEDGTRLVVRSCGDFNTCYRDWFQGSSDNDKCSIYNENSLVTLKFKCTFCCIKDKCNVPIKPLDESLYSNL